MPRGAYLVLLTLLTLALCAGCARTRTTCGQPRDGGGPPVLTTREDHVCESVRWRVLQNLRVREGLSPHQADALYRAAGTWSAATSLDDLRRRISQDAADSALAAEITATARTAWGKTDAPPGADCGASDEACVARAAARGAWVALRRRHAYVRSSPDMLERERTTEDALQRLTE